jgi:hypothetical protein
MIDIAIQKRTPDDYISVDEWKTAIAASTSIRLVEEVPTCGENRCSPATGNTPMFVRPFAAEVWNPKTKVWEIRLHYFQGEVQILVDVDEQNSNSPIWRTIHELAKVLGSLVMDSDREAIPLHRVQ